MTTIETSSTQATAPIGLAGLVGDVAQDNARPPGDTASSFGALMGSLGQGAMPKHDVQSDGDSLAADDGGAQSDAAPEMAQAPAEPGDALMRAMWPSWQAFAPQVAVGAATRVAEGVVQPASVSVSEAPQGEAQAQEQGAPAVNPQAGAEAVSLHSAQGGHQTS